MALRVPPPEIPVVTFLSPNKSDQGLIEFWNSEVASYVPLDVGAPHPNSRLYPGFTLGKQAPVQGDEKWIIRTWVTPETSPEWFNYALKYSAEDNDFPIFIRTYRIAKIAYVPRVKGSTLGKLYKLAVLDAGSGYANGSYPAVIFDDPTVAPVLVATAHGVVSSDGTISECVLDFCGSGYDQDVAFTVETPLNGIPASGLAYVQPSSAILVKEEANLYPPESEFYAQYFQVTRVYETLPGPTLYSTKLDTDGATVSVGTTRKLCSDITTGESIVAGVWTKTTKRQTDTDFVCEEIVEVRAIPGNPMESTKVDEDGKIITRTQTYVDSTTIVSSETIVAGVWIRKFEEQVDGTDVVSFQIVESRPVPGNAVPSTRLDEDGVKVNLVTTLKDTTAITTSETIVAGVWTKKTKKAVSDLVAQEIVETRALPGNPIAETTFDEGGNEIDTARTMKDESTISTSEVLGGGIWTRTTKKAITDLVAWEVVEARDIPGVAIPSARVGEDGETELLVSTVKDASVIVPGQTEAAGVLTTIEQEKISELISNEVVSTKDWLDTASYTVSIPESIIPVEFRASITTTVESHVLAGLASLPTLSAGEFEHTKRQLTKKLYEERITKLSDLSFPVTQTGQETSSEFGGAILDVNRTLHNVLLTSDEGEDIVSSYVNPIGDNLMWFKETKQRPGSDAAWPIIPSRLWDENMRVEYDETSQVLVTGTAEDANPGVFGWVSEVKGLDKWHARKINTSKPTPDFVDEASALVTYEYKPFKFPGLLFFLGLSGYVRQASAQLCRHTIRTWWETSASTPVIAVDEIFVDQIIINTLNNVSLLEYQNDVLHDDFTAFGVLFYPATTPSYTDYVGSWLGNEKIVAASVTPEREKDVWKCQTRSIVMR